MSRRTPLGPPPVIRNGTHRGEEGRESTSRARSSSSSGCLSARCGLIALRVETAVLRMATGGIPPRRVIWSTSASRASSSLRRLARASPQHWICFALAFRLCASFVTVASMCSKIATSPMVPGPARLGGKRRRCALTLMSVRVSSRLVATAPVASVVGLWARKRSIQVLRAHLKVSRSMRRSS